MILFTKNFSQLGVPMLLQDADLIGIDNLGAATVDLDKIFTGERVDLELALVDANGKPVGQKLPGSKTVVDSKLFVSIHYKPVTEKVGSHISILCLINQQVWHCVGCMDTGACTAGGKCFLVATSTASGSTSAQSYNN